MYFLSFSQRIKIYLSSTLAVSKNSKNSWKHRRVFLFLFCGLGYYKTVSGMKQEKKAFNLQAQTSRSVIINLTEVWTMNWTFTLFVSLLTSRLGHLWETALLWFCLASSRFQQLKNGLASIQAGLLFKFQGDISFSSFFLLSFFTCHFRHFLQWYSKDDLDLGFEFGDKSFN